MANNESVKGDLISRSVLLEEIKPLRVTVMGLRAGKGILAEYANQYKNTLFRVIEEQPTAYNDGWIPCSDTLPENIKTVLVQVKEFEEPTIGRYGNMLGWILSEKEFDEINDFTVIAWKPLPQIYHQKGEGNYEV